VGRQSELERLVAFATGEGPLVFHLHGLPGIGKTRLLHALADRLRDEAPDVVVTSVDAGEVEPSPAGLCAWLAPGAADPAGAARAVSAAGSRVLVVIDRYETFRLLDTWLRQALVPALGENVRVLVAGRAPPRPAWFVAPGWSGQFTSLELGPLPPDVALAYLTSHGVEPAEAAALERVAAGHPLALSMAAALVGAGGSVRTGVSGAPGALVDHLAELFLEDVPDPTTRRVLQAACLVRTVTAPVIEAMLPDLPAEDALARLRALPFVRPTAHGLVVDDAVRAALDRALAATDPRLRADHRRAAAAVVTRQVHASTRAELWRTTADVLYLLENPDLREAFFPRRANAISMEPATEADGAAVREIVARHEGVDAAAAFAPSWRHHLASQPPSCHVARDASGQVVGLVQVLRPAGLARAVLDRDPVLARWAQHLPAADDRARALWVRRLLDRDGDEQPSAAQAAAWLDIKRTYLELRPSLRWVYACVRARAVHEHAMRRLGFTLLDAAPIRFSGRSFYSLVLDMGADSVDGWLARLVAEEVGGGTSLPAPETLLDEAAHQVVVDGERIPLTPLELGALAYLRRRPGEAVTRHELLESVWEHPPDAATSNVVEAVIRSLRRKLGRHAAALETVRGVGYRFRATGAPR